MEHLEISITVSQTHFSEEKTGSPEYHDFLPVDSVRRAEEGWEAFIKALEEYKTNVLTNGSLK